jgi:hypothetical protein
MPNDPNDEGTGGKLHERAFGPARWMPGSGLSSIV